MYAINDYLLHARSLSDYAKALSLRSEQKYGEALLYACDSAASNNKDYAPLVLMAEIVALDGQSREMSRALYIRALDVAQTNRTERQAYREYDIKKLQEIVRAHSTITSD